MKRMITGMAAALLAAVLFFPVSAVSADSYILMDGLTGRILEQRNADDRSLIASTTKIMTALVVCEQANVLDRVRIPKEAVGIEGSSVYLKEGEILTVQELLYAMMLHSGNDAATALAIYCGGTVEGFAQLMNDKAHLLDLANTHFVNPHGLDAPDHYSTAADLAKLTAYAMKNPIFVRTVSAKIVTINNRQLRNHNKLLWQVDGADGVKTGYTKAAGRILVSTAVRNGRRLICVTINDPNDWHDHKKLIENGFLNYSIQSIVEEGNVITQVDVAGGTAQNVELVADASFHYPLSAHEKVAVVFPQAGFVYAPVVKGASAGYANLLIGDEIVGRVPLVYGATIEQQRYIEQPFWKKLLKGCE